MVAGRVLRHIDRKVHDRDHGMVQVPYNGCSLPWSTHLVVSVEERGMSLRMRSWFEHSSKRTWGFQQQVRSGTL